MPVVELAFAVVEKHNDPSRVPGGHVVQGGVLHNVQITVAIHVRDLACSAKGAVSQVAHPSFSIVDKVARAIVDQKEIFGRASSSVDTVVHEVEVFGPIARQIASPNGTNQRLVAAERWKALRRFVQKTQPLSLCTFPLVHVQHGLLVEGVRHHHVVPSIAVHVRHVNVPCKTWVGQKLWSIGGGGVHEHPVLIEQQQV